VALYGYKVMEMKFGVERVKLEGEKKIETIRLEGEKEIKKIKLEVENEKDRRRWG